MKAGHKFCARLLQPSVPFAVYRGESAFKGVAAKEDRDIIALYFARAESAIAETAEKYGGYCRAIASRIIKSPEDTEECLSDT